MLFAFADVKDCISGCVGPGPSKFLLFFARENSFLSVLDFRSGFDFSGAGGLEKKSEFLKFFMVDEPLYLILLE
jgi:hypothetical protein